MKRHYIWVIRKLVYHEPLMGHEMHSYRSLGELNKAVLYALIHSLQLIYLRFSAQ